MAPKTAWPKIEEAIQELAQHHSSTDCQSASAATGVEQLVKEAQEELDCLALNQPEMAEVLEDESLIKMGLGEAEPRVAAALDRLIRKTTAAVSASVRAWEEAADVVAQRRRTLEAIGLRPEAAGVLDEVETLLRARAARGEGRSTTALDLPTKGPIP